jgi:DNA-binding phage protein
MIEKILRDIIKKENLTYRGIARELGIDHGSLYRSLMDGANPEWKTIKKLLDHLGYGFKVIKKRR